MEHHPRRGLNLDDIRELALRELADRPVDDTPLTDAQRCLIRLGVASVTTALDVAAVRACIAEALDRGISAETIVEVQTLVSAIGVHALHEGVRELREELLGRGFADISSIDSLDETRIELRTRYTGTSSYWARLERELPGFLDGLLTLSPAAYQAFFEFCAVPWRHGSLDGLTNELIYLAIDATATHRYGPGFRLHLTNCLRLGATRQQVLETLDLAAAAPGHPGVR